MKAKLLTKQVGPYEMNTYVVIDEVSNKSAIVDPGGDPEKILRLAAGTQVEKILLTHGHGDHVMALDDIKGATGAPVHLHPADGLKFEVEYDVPLEGGTILEIGGLEIQVIHVPGHTPGQCCFKLDESRIIVGDTVFVGGPGHTGSPEDFTTTMDNMQDIVFKWPDTTQFFPGHGPSGTIGDEKPAFTAFLNRGWSTDTHGDITWA